MIDTATLTTVVTTGKLRVDLDRKLVSVDGNPLHLTGEKYRILELMSLRKGVVISKNDFQRHLYGDDMANWRAESMIGVLVFKLRKIIAEATGGDDYIDTIRGKGYVLRDPK